MGQAHARNLSKLNGVDLVWAVDAMGTNAEAAAAAAPGCAPAAPEVRSQGIFSQRTHRTQEARVYSHVGPIGCRKR
eukprot:9385373-Pyramimonas_sp.AAC.1